MWLQANETVANESVEHDQLKLLVLLGFYCTHRCKLEIVLIFALFLTRYIQDLSTVLKQKLCVLGPNVSKLKKRNSTVCY